MKRKLASQERFRYISRKSVPNQETEVIQGKQKNQEAFLVTIEEGGESKEYTVTLDDGYWKKLTQGNITKEGLIKKFLNFLLERRT